MEGNIGISLGVLKKSIFTAKHTKKAQSAQSQIHVAQFFESLAKILSELCG
jgi:hypothetical protein